MSARSKHYAIWAACSAGTFCAAGAWADMPNGAVPPISITNGVGACVTPEHQAEFRAILDAWFAGHPAARGNPPPMQHFPIGGNLYDDIWMGAFVDLDPTAGALDFDCTEYTRDGHAGIDAGPRWFAEKRIGVPVFAAADGTVIYTADGESDENTAGSATPGNLIFVDHGFGEVGMYYHLANGSVAVSVNDEVRAGQQIGLAASSGYSFGPHLHFELQRAAVPYEPFSGACRPGPSGWQNQPAIDRAHFFFDFGVTHEEIATFPWWPEPFPREGQIAVTDEFMEFWVLGAGLPANSNWRVQFRRPDGVITFDSTTLDWGNPTLYQWYVDWWHYPLNIIPDIQTTLGTWHILIDVNGVRMIEAPVEIRAARTPEFNRPPEPINVAFDPPDPTPADVVHCRVSTSRTLDDVDYDVVRYHYVWKRNGAVIRDVTTAAQSDAIPHHTAFACDALTCEVTPGDGRAEGPTATAMATIGTGCVGDLDGDAAVGLGDLAVILSNFGTTSGATGADGDVDCDGDVDLTDLATLLGRFGQGC